MSRSHRPAPAIRVSSTWLSKLSSGASTPAIPPWAHELLLVWRVSLVTTRTRRSTGTSRAARSPAMPAPTTSRSVKRWGVSFGPNDVRYRRGNGMRGPEEENQRSLTTDSTDNTDQRQKIDRYRSLPFLSVFSLYPCYPCYPWLNFFCPVPSVV